MWDIGDWWNAGEAYGERAQVVTAGGWTGPKHKTCRDAGYVANRFDVSMRIDTLTFEHHQIAASMPDEKATALLQWCAEADPTTRAEVVHLGRRWTQVIERQRPILGEPSRTAHSFPARLPPVLRSRHG